MEEKGRGKVELSKKRMRKKDLRKKGTAALAAALAAGMLIPSVAFAVGPDVKVGTDSSVQMSSNPEVVYVNNYTGITRSEDFSANWKFYLGSPSGAETPGFDDSSWDQVNLPHDYSIEQAYTQTGEAESGYLPGGTGWYRKNFTLDKSTQGKRIRIDFGGVYMNSTVWVNGTQVGMHPYGYTPFSFDITEYVKFGQDNVITVKVDHQTPSSRWYSGSGIYRSVDLTVTAPVHVDLYGTKIETPKLDTENGGSVTTNISTTVANDSEQEQSVTLTHTVFPKGGDPDADIGTVTTNAQTVEPGGTANIAAELQAESPVLWDTSENPALYTVRTEVKVNDEVVDTYNTEYGFRYFDFDVNTGFSLNGVNMKLKGVCMHHDQGSLGAEAWESAIDRQVRILKEMGCNSIRVTHNPASDELIEACNEQGILVIDEFFDGWMYPKNGNTHDYSEWFNVQVEDGNQILGAEDGMTWAQFDLTATVKRGWNAPSVFMWSIGNEVQEGTRYGLNAAYAEAQTKLINWTQALDKTRPVTRGDNNVKGSTSGTGYNILDSLSKAGGIVGLNYTSGAQYDNQHAASKDWIIYGSETASSVNSRGIYNRTTDGGRSADKQLTSYDGSWVSWGASASGAWYDVITRDFVAGEYVWTGFDYLGEPTHWNGVGAGAQGAWPSPKNSYFGIVDTAGFPKDSYYFYQSQWNDEVRTLHILPAWNENVVAKDNTGKVPVVVYTDADKVQLYFTSQETNEKKLLGEKVLTERQSNGSGYTYKIYEGDDADSTKNKNLYLTWKVPYEAGTIEAVAYDLVDGEYVKITDTEGRSSVTTTGSAAKLSASTDRKEIAADGRDLVYITVDVTDADGNIVPNAANNVKFEVAGEGRLVGVDNGNSPDHQSYQADNRNAFSGKVLAIVQATKTAGEITVTASSNGLDPATVTLNTTPVADETGEAVISHYEMSRNYYVKVGNMPQLPKTVKAVYSDGNYKDLAVDWDNIPEEQIAKTGTFAAGGTTEAGDQISVTVNMIDQVAALLNYSAMTPAGVPPVLPDTRPAVLADGTVVTASFPVTWDTEGKDYSTEGIVTVNGTASVLGEELPVTAAIRVQKEQITIGNNIAPQASLSQSIPADKQSDVLTAIIDNSTANNPPQTGTNNTIWSNYTYSQEGNTTAEIYFDYATQQRIGEIKIYFTKDSFATRYPDAETTQIYYSNTKSADGVYDWQPLPAKEVIGEEENGNVKPYTYEISPVMATYLKICITNKNEVISNRKSCTGITEVIFNEAQGTFTTNTEAEFTSMTVNGLSVRADQLSAGTFDTEAILVGSLAYETSENAAVTELPVYDEKKVLIIESEDHNKRNKFVINLGAEVSSGSTDADDNSRDYDHTKTMTEAGSEHPGTGQEGPASNAVDNNTGTWWHTNWQTLPPKEDLWITLELEEETTLDALRYLGRSGSSPNGRVTEYLVEVSPNNQDWETVSTGTWENTEGWKLAVFNEPTTAKYVRLTGLHTYADSGNDKFMSAVEIRLRTPEEKDDISNAVIEPETITKEVSIADADHPVTLAGDEFKVTLGDQELRYGVDYIITSYADNTAPGTAKAVIQGLGQYGYTGAREIEFAITVREPELSEIKITVPCKKIYTEGEKFDPSGLILTAVYDNDTEQTVSYADYAADIAFSFADGTALTSDTVLTLNQNGTSVTVTYGGKATAFTINVNAAQTPGPEPGTDPAPTPGTGDNDPQTPSGNTGSVSGGSQTGHNTQNGSEGKAVNTGDTSDFALWGAAALLAGGAVIIAGKKREKA